MAETDPRMRYTEPFRVLSWRKGRVQAKWTKEHPAVVPIRRIPQEEVPSTITTATSPSLLDRFHSFTLKYLKTLRNGCCHAAGVAMPSRPGPGNQQGSKTVSLRQLAHGQGTHASGAKGQASEPYRDSNLRPLREPRDP